METIDEAKAYLREHYRDGVLCPCCRQMVKEYRRVLNAGMARALILIALAGPGRWIDIKTIDTRGGDYAKLRHWGLLERHGEIEGLWRVTPAGLEFAHDRERVPRYAHVLLGVCRGLSGSKIGIREALANKFDYQQLMSS